MSSSELPNERAWEKLFQVAVHGAVYDSRERLPHPKCLKGTRVRLLKHIYVFLDNPEKSQLIWLHGTAGVGKSAVAFTVAERMRDLKASEETTVEKRLAGTFFFSRTNTKRCTTGYVFATLAYQLARNFPSVRSDVCRAIIENPAVLDPTSSLRDQMESLFLRPLRKLHRRLHGCPPLSFVIDALDECASEAELAELISLLAKALRESDLPKLHILVTSRSEAYVREAMEEEEAHPLVCEIPVKNSGDGVPDIISLDGADVDNDIYVFLNHSFTKLQHRYPDFPQPTSDQLVQLATRAGRRFIVASTMMKFIDDEHNDPRERLQIMLNLTSQLLPGTEVYKLYDSILSTCADPNWAFMHMSVVAALADPLPASQISKLLGPGEGKDVEATLVQLRSVMDIPTDSSLSVNIYHSSVRDYVSNPSNCSLPNLQYIPPHSLLAYSSLSLMIHDIPASTALLDGLVELKRHNEVMPSKDPKDLRESLAFVVQSPVPLQVLSGLLWFRTRRAPVLRCWLKTPDGRAWLETDDGFEWLSHEVMDDDGPDESGTHWLWPEGGYGWLETENGKEWLERYAHYWLCSIGGKTWLKTPAGQNWLQTADAQYWVGEEAHDVRHERIWLDTKDGKNWLQTQAGQSWLQTPTATSWLPCGEWLPTKAGKCWLQTQAGKSWLETQAAKEWLLTTHEGGDWLQRKRGRDWLQSQSDGDWMLAESGGQWRPILDDDEEGTWLQTSGGRAWFQSQSIQDWLQTSRGRCWLRAQHKLDWLLPEGGKDRLETEGGSEWLENRVGQDWLWTKGGRDWLSAEGGKDWLQRRGGKAWVQTESGQDWLWTDGGRDWVSTDGGRDWLKTEGGKDWLQTQRGQRWLWIFGGQDWLKTEGGRDWLKTRAGKDWLQIQSRQGWLETFGGQDWLKTEGGNDWLKTRAGQDWVQTCTMEDRLRSGNEWLQTQVGEDRLQFKRTGQDRPTLTIQERLQLKGAVKWLRTQDGEDLLQTKDGRDWLQTEDGRDWLQTEDAQWWVATQDGQDWLQTQSGRDWLQTYLGQDWLETRGGEDWLQTESGRDWLQTHDGKAWPFMGVWMTLVEFWSALEAISQYPIVPELPCHPPRPALEVIQHLKSLPDFLMFPVFLALRHHDNAVSASPQDHLPDVEIIHAMKAFVNVANNSRERSQSASDALKYACHNWAIHLARAPRPWGTMLGNILVSFWNHNLLYWLEMQWCSKGLRACLADIYEGETLVGEYLAHVRLGPETR